MAVEVLQRLMGIGTTTVPVYSVPALMYVHARCLIYRTKDHIKLNINTQPFEILTYGILYITEILWMIMILLRAFESAKVKK